MLCKNDMKFGDYANNIEDIVINFYRAIFIWNSVYTSKSFTAGYGV